MNVASVCICNRKGVWEKEQARGSVYVCPNVSDKRNYSFFHHQIIFRVQCHLVNKQCLILVLSPNASIVIIDRVRASDKAEGVQQHIMSYIISSLALTYL